MAAYDQVLAKLGKVGASVPQAGTKKRKQAEAEAEAEEGPAEVHKKKKNKRKSSSAQEPSLQAAAVLSAEGGLQTEVLTAAADEVPPTTDAKASQALSRSSHLARFGRRRAGKNVRRCVEVLVTKGYCFQYAQMEA